LRGEIWLYLGGGGDRRYIGRGREGRVNIINDVGGY